MSSSDNDPKKAEEMSLAELLGKSEATSVSPEASPQEEESDDDKSGLINLSQMANMLTQPTPSQETSSFPGASGAPAGSMPPSGPASSVQPPTAGDFSQTGGGVQPATGGFSQNPAPATSDAYDNVASPARKKPTAIIVIAAIALIAGGVGAFVAFSGGEKNDGAAQLAEMDKNLENAQDSVATAEPAATAPNVADAAAAGDPSAATAVENADESADEGDEATAEDDEEEYEIMEEEVVDKKGHKRRRKVRRLKRKPTTKSTTTTNTKAAPVAKKETQTASAAPASSGGSKKTSALDSLLSSGGGGSAKESGGLPQKPSRAQVQKAMAPVVRKARNSCKKSGSGKVSVRIIAGSNGVVRDAIPLGAHSADSLGRCVATFARKTARLPAFKAPTFTFTYPFNI